MTTLLSVQGVSKAYGAASVLQDVTFLLHDGERAGLVGANGAGKSTLLRILAGLADADAGTVTTPAAVDVGYLPQEPEHQPGDTIDGVLNRALDTLRAAEATMAALTQAMATATGSALQALMDDYAEAAAEFERHGGYDIDHRIDTVLTGLGVAHLPRSQAFAMLSGGEKARVAMAALLLQSPSVLLLDEPTNHLDAASTEWLEACLAAYPGAVLAVSHDRRFLNRAVTTIFEIDDHHHTLQEYPGNYDAYRDAKAAERERWQLAYEQQQGEIRDLRRIAEVTGHEVSHNRPRTDHDKVSHNFFGERVQRGISRNVRNARERLRRVEEAAIERPPLALQIAPAFEASALQSDLVVRVTGVGKAYSGRTVLQDVSFSLGGRDRVLLTGPNGAGKSTLLRLLAGEAHPDAGTVEVARRARPGYLDQEGTHLNPTHTVLQAYRQGLTGTEDELTADLFRFGLFTADDLLKPVGALSVGQRRKLQIARLVAQRPNLLLLDEPGNHLNLEVLEAFEHAIDGFAGATLVVSHDRWFAERFRGEHWRLQGGHLSGNLR